MEAPHLINVEDRKSVKGEFRSGSSGICSGQPRSSSSEDRLSMTRGSSQGRKDGRKGRRREGSPRIPTVDTIGGIAGMRSEAGIVIINLDPFS